MEEGLTEKSQLALDSIKQRDAILKANDPYPMALSYVIGTYNNQGHFNSSKFLLKDLQDYLDSQSWQDNSQLPRAYFQSIYWLLSAQLSIALGDNEKALEHLNKMNIDETRIEFIGYDPEIKEHYFNRIADLAIYQTASVLKNSGNLEKAKIVFYKIFLELEKGDFKYNLKFSSIANLCEIYHKLGNRENYLSELERAKNSIVANQKYESWLGLVELYLLDKNYVKAHFYLHKIEDEIGDKMDELEDKNFFYNFNTQMGLYYAAIDQNSLAINYFDKNFNTNLPYFNEAIIYPINNHIYLAKSHYAIEDYTKCLDELDQAIELIEGEKVHDPLKHHFKGAQKFALLDIFQLLSDITFNMDRNIAGAINYNAKAIDLINLERKKVILPRDKQLLMQAAYPVFEQGISLLFQSDLKNKESRIFDLMEQSKALNLIDDLIQADLFNQLDVAPDIIEEVKNINGLINYTKTTIEKSNSDFKQLEGLNKKLDSLLNIREGIISDIYSSSIKPLNKYETNIAISRLQNKLISDETCFIEFFQGKDYIYTLAINNKESNVSRIALSEQIINEIELFHSSIARGDNDFKKLSYQLFQKLIAPHQALLKKQIVIAPDGALNVLPFDALCTKEVSQSTRLKDYPFLIKSNNISLSYSAIFLHMVQQNKIKQNNGNLLAINPDYTANADFESLDFSAQEINFLDEAFDARVLSSSFANKSQIDSIIENYSMIHFSSHAVADLKKGRNSYIALDNAKISIDDSCRLKAHEIRNYKLQAELVVLSACETGIGSFEKGEGVMSLGRSFIHAGAKGVLSSLWSVSDKSTALLTTEFYKLINTGLNKPEAISVSKRNLLKDANFAHPYFWAGFYYTGDIKSKSNFNLNWAWIGLPFFMLFIFFIHKFSSKQK